MKISLRHSILILSLFMVLNTHGAEYSKKTLYTPTPVTVHVLSIPKDEFHIQVYSVEEPYVQELSYIVKETKALFGVNGGFFGRENNEILGLLSINGEILSKKKVFGRGSLTISHSNQLCIKKMAPAELTQKNAQIFRAILSGGHTLVQNSLILHTQSRKNPMTAIGYSENRIFIVVAEGRSLTSWGIDERKLAVFMKELGCTDAIAMDGGGSSEVCLSHKAEESISGFEKGEETNGTFVLNKTSDGNERPIKTAILFYSENNRLTLNESVKETTAVSIINDLNRRGYKMSLIRKKIPEIFRLTSTCHSQTVNGLFTRGKKTDDDLLLILRKDRKKFIKGVSYFPKSKGQPVVEATEGLEYFSIVSRSENEYFFNVPKEELIARSELCRLLIFMAVSDIINRCKEI